MPGERGNRQKRIAAYSRFSRSRLFGPWRAFVFPHVRDKPREKFLRQDISEAFLFPGTSRPAVKGTRTARERPFKDKIPRPGRIKSPMSGCRAKKRGNRGSHGRGKVHGTGIAGYQSVSVPKHRAQFPQRSSVHKIDALNAVTFPVRVSPHDRHIHSMLQTKPGQGSPIFQRPRLERMCGKRMQRD